MILYGREFWDGALNLEYLADEGTIRDEHLSPVQYPQTPPEAWEIIRKYYRLEEAHC